MMGAHGMKDDGRGRKRTRGAAALSMPKGGVRARKRAKAKAAPIAAGWVIFAIVATGASWTASGMASSMAFE